MAVVSFSTVVAADRLEQIRLLRAQAEADAQAQRLDDQRQADRLDDQRRTQQADDKRRTEQQDETRRVAQTDEQRRLEQTDDARRVQARDDEHKQTDQVDQRRRDSIQAEAARIGGTQAYRAQTAPTTDVVRVTAERAVAPQTILPPAPSTTPTGRIDRVELSPSVRPPAAATAA